MRLLGTRNAKTPQLIGQAIQTASITASSQAALPHPAIRVGSTVIL